jgi:curved DNA-binding protein CbpA
LKNYYSLLGVDFDASKDDVKQAYVRLAKKYHPDLGQNFCSAEKRQLEDMMKEINEAYSTLSDARKRKFYDEKLKPSLDRKKIIAKRRQYYRQHHRTEQLKRQNIRIRIDLDLCMGYASCISMYPELFYFDEDARKKKWLIFYDHAPLRMRNLFNIDVDKLLVAAQSCPTKAIIIEDAETGEQMYPFS